jgi:hypothetical protein
MDLQNQIALILSLNDVDCSPEQLNLKRQLGNCNYLIIGGLINNDFFFRKHGFCESARKEKRRDCLVEEGYCYVVGKDCICEQTKRRCGEDI